MMGLVVLTRMAEWDLDRCLLHFSHVDLIDKLKVHTQDSWIWVLTASLSIFCICITQRDENILCKVDCPYPYVSPESNLFLTCMNVSFFSQYIPVPVPRSSTRFGWLNGERYNLPPVSIKYMWCARSIRACSFSSLGYEFIGSVSLQPVNVLKWDNRLTRRWKPSLKAWYLRPF